MNQHFFPIVVLAICLPHTANAQTLHDILPPSMAVARVLQEHPAIQAGRQGFIAGQAERRKLEAGPYEWTLRSQQQRRKAYNATPGATNGETNYHEWNIALERSLRLPGKAVIDLALGSAAESAAQIAAEELRHETSRELLRLWFAWLREKALEQQWTAQGESIKQQQIALARRVQLGDAARLEQVQLEAAKALIETQLAQAKESEEKARSMLQEHFPGLTLSPAGHLPPPTPPLADSEALIEQILSHNHELELALATSQQSELQAARSRQERLPDPSVGVQWGKERGGEEKLLAVYISWPLSGDLRAASSDYSQAQAAASRLNTEAIRRRIVAEARTLVQGVQQAVTRWPISERAAEYQEKAADMSLRAWQLGEGTLNELLIARKLANEARTNARMQHLAALELEARLQLELHKLWKIH